MGKSKKRTPISTFCCSKSQKRGKQICHRKYRRIEHMMLRSNNDEHLPIRQYEIVSPWNLGGDGKVYWGHYPDKEWYKKLMRK